MVEKLGFRRYLETNIILRSVSFKDVNNGVAVGSSGSILRTTNGGVTFIEVSNYSPQPNDFSLSQNYPNPFNPSTTIRYEIPEGGFVSLKIYDVVGNEIATLVNEAKLAGSYEVEFNIYSDEGQNLVSGVYFYQIVRRANGTPRPRL